MACKPWRSYLLGFDGWCKLRILCPCQAKLRISQIPFRIWTKTYTRICVPSIVSIHAVRKPVEECFKKRRFWRTPYMIVRSFHYTLSTLKLPWYDLRLSKNVRSFWNSNRVWIRKGGMTYRAGRRVRLTSFLMWRLPWTTGSFSPPGSHILNCTYEKSSLFSHSVEVFSGIDAEWVLSFDSG